MQNQTDASNRLGGAVGAFLRRLGAADRRTKTAILILADIATCMIAAWLALSLRLGYWQIFTGPGMIVSAVGALAFIPIAFSEGVYSGIVRHTGLRGLLQLARTCLFTAIPTVIVFSFITVKGVPRTIGLLFPLVLAVLILIQRSSARYILSSASGKIAVGGDSRALIYGAGTAGRQLAASLHMAHGTRVVGYVDDDERLDRHRLDGLRIHHTSRLEDLLERERINCVYLAMPSISRTRRREIVERLQARDVLVQTVPSIREIVEGRVNFSDLRPIAIEDLLGRDQVPPNEILLRRTIAGKTVLVSGAGGSIGSELCRQIVDCEPSRLILLEMSEHALFEIDSELRERVKHAGSGVEIIAELGSAADGEKLHRVFARWMPQTVYHAAAYKHVPLVEANPLSGVNNNVFSTLALAEAARRAKVERFILISTDKAVRPTNVMGSSKRICELVLQAFADTARRKDEKGATLFTMVRFGNVLGSSGSVVPRFKEQIKAGGPITLTHRDVTRYFMTIPEAAQLVLQAGAMGQGGDVFVLDMGMPVKIYDLARTMVQLAGCTVRDEKHPDGDIAIEEVGLRPGEKLYEELLIGETREDTQHPRIIRSAEYFIPEDQLLADLAVLKDAINRGDRGDALVMVRKLVPEYAPREESAGSAALSAG